MNINLSPKKKTIEKNKNNKKRIWVKLVEALPAV